MSLSTARRERLIGPVSLFILAGVFLLAFFVLRPSAVPGTNTRLQTAGLGSDKNVQLSLDELDLAYIRAARASGDIDDADVVRVMLVLLENARHEEVIQMLAQYTDLSIDAPSRSIIDMRLAAADSDAALSAELQGLLGHVQQHSISVLETAIELSKRLQQPSITVELYEVMAGLDGVQRKLVYRQCGDHMASVQQTDHAVRCYQAALDIDSESTDSVEIRLALIPHLSRRTAEQAMQINAVLDRDDLSVFQMEKFASLVLAAERPDIAYRIYARLALADEDNKARWLRDAATWAQASNQPEDAAVFLDSLVSDVSGVQRDALHREIITLLVAAGQAENAFKRTQKKLARWLSSGVSLIEASRLDQELAHGVSLARQVGETQQALEWNTQRLSADPGNAALLALQVELALAAADLPQALKYAQSSVTVSPDDAEVREHLARVSEWNGQLADASRQWLWLSSKRNNPDETARRQALREQVRLSSALFDSAQAVAALRELSLFEAPGDEDITRLVTLYEMEGLPVHAALALNDIMILHGKSPFVLRSLALLEYKHKRFSNSLAAWQQYADLYGNAREAILYQMELLWRLDRPDEAAEAARGLRGRTLLSQASDYQLRLMAEIAWRYRMSWLEELVQPRILTFDEINMQALYGRRTVEALEQAGRDRDALEQAIELWNGTGQPYFALSSMQLALKRGEQQVLDEFLPEKPTSSGLKSLPAYWAGLAAVHLRNQQPQAARAAYRQALMLDAEHVESIQGLIWMDIAQAEAAPLQNTLQRYALFAQSQPTLWQAMAVGYLQLGAASSSVLWFEKLLDQIDTDYGMLLTYADALEYAGRAADAERLRHYTLFELRPLLVEGVEEEQSLALRQYARLSARYATTNDNDALVQELLNELQSGNLDDDHEAIWREDLAISWLMSTQRHEQARIVMSNLHSRRLEAPVWQRLALAIRDKDRQTIEAIVQTKGPLSIGNHILALRQLGNDRQAYALAQQALRTETLNPRLSPAEMQSVVGQYAALRNSLPSYVGAMVAADSIAGLDSTRQGLSIRHTMIGFPLGVGVDITRQRLSTANFRYDGDEELNDVALSLFFGNRFRGGRVSAGMLSEDERNQPYADAQWYTVSANEKRRYNMELAYRERMNDSAELYLGARQNRVSASVDASLGRLPFLRVQADARQINTRVSQERFADGLGGQVELGLRGAVANNQWSTSVQAGQISYERSDTLPPELQLGEGSSVDSVLQENAQRLSIGASLSRGDVNAGFAQVRTARYFLNARLGHSWPSRVSGLSVGAGAGIRVLGGDELSFSVQHDTQGVSRNEGDFTSLGVNYRYHF